MEMEEELTVVSRSPEKSSLEMQGEPAVVKFPPTVPVKEEREKSALMSLQSQHPQSDKPQSGHPQSDKPQSEHPQSEKPQSEYPQPKNPALTFAATDFPNGWRTVSVDGSGLLCGLRALATSISAQTDLRAPTLNKLMSIYKGPDVQKLNQLVGLTNESFFFVDQLASIVRVYSQRYRRSLQLCVFVSGREPIATIWPLETPPTGRIWIHSDNATQLLGHQGPAVDHFNAVVPHIVEPQATPDEDFEATSDEKVEFCEAEAGSPPTEVETTIPDAAKEIETLLRGNQPITEAFDEEFQKRLQKSFGGLSFGKEACHDFNRRNHIEHFTAAVLDRKTNQPILKYQNHNLLTQLRLRFDFFRPYLKVSVQLPAEKVDTWEDEEDLQEDFEENVIEATYIYQSISRGGPRALNKPESSGGKSETTVDGNQAVVRTEPQSKMVVRGLRFCDISSPTSEKAEKQIAALGDETWKMAKKWKTQRHKVILLDIFHSSDFTERGVFFGTPAWGEAIARALKDEVYTRVLVAGYPTTLTDLKLFVEFMARNPSPLSRFHLGVNRGSFTPTALAETGDLQESGFERMISFHDIHEYATVQYIAFNKENETLCDDVTNFSSKVHIIHLLASSTVQDDAAYYAFLGVDPEEAFRPRTGDIFKLSFNTDDNFDHPNKAYWKFQVAEPVGFGPRDAIPGVVTRPWIKHLRIFDAADPRILALGPSLSFAAADAALHADPGNLCCLQVNESTRVANNVASSFDRLVFTPKDQPPTYFNKRVKQVLLARRIDELTLHDFFHVPRAALGEVDMASLMQLNGKQVDAVRGMERARGGVPITQGPPGTGKTHLITQTCIPFLLMSEKKTHVIASPSNAGADAIAVSVHKLAEKLRSDPSIVERHPHLQHEHECYVVRLYSKGLETALRELITKVNRDRSRDARPPTFSGETEQLLSELSQVEKMIHQVISKSEETVLPGIRDPRLKQFSLSISARMLQSLGLWPDEQAKFQPPWPGFLERHGRLKVLMNQKLNGEKLSPERTEEHGHDVLKLATEILQSARVVVGTTAAVASQANLEIFKHTAAAITLDEAAREIEAYLIPILANGFTQDPGIHLAGDHGQLPPMARVNRKIAVTASQLELSLMKRLVLAGFPYTMLDTQYRMHPDIVAPINQIFYKGKLKSAPGLDQQRGVGAFRTMSHKFTGYYTNAFWINVDTLQYNRGKEDRNTKATSKVKINISPSGSKSCEFHALYGMNIAEILLQLHPEARICILTQYTAQKNLYLQGIEKMRTLDPDLAVRLSAETIDGAQGLEYDGVIVDLVIDDRVGMLALAARLKVANTRAKAILINLSSFRAIADALGRAVALRNLIEFYRNRGKVMRLSNTFNWPRCKYLTPAEANWA